jgi:hypothetical protein
MVDVDAIPLPDVSVGRSKYGHPEWLRIDEDHLEDDNCSDWAVIGFAVKDIPAELVHQGVGTWTFGPVHVPKNNNFPHSEVQCQEAGQHVNAKARLDKDVHQRWRQKLLWKVRVFIRPYQEVDVPQDPPNR